MTTLINNPNAAFGQDHSGSAVVQEFVAGSGGVLEGQHVQGAVNGDGNLIVTTATAVGHPVVGIAAASAAVGEVVPVVTHGPARVRAGGSSVAAGASISAGTSGRVGAGGTSANNIRSGFALEATGTTDDVLVWMFVNPHTVTAS